MSEGLSAETRPKVAVVIVSWNTRELLARAIQSVALDVQPPHRIYVVDNASTDGSPDWVAAAHPEVVLIRNGRNLGFGQANNLAFAASVEPYVLLLNSDAELCDGALATMLETLRQHPGTGVVGARLCNPDGSFQGSFANFPSLMQELLLLSGLARRLMGRSFPSQPESRSQRAQVVDWVGGACMLVSREAIDAIGGFDPDFHMYSEETDFCRRLKSAGFATRYCPSAVALHHGGRSTIQRLAEQPLLLWRSRLIYFQKHHPAWQNLTLKAAIHLAYALRAAYWRLRASLAGPAASQDWLTRAEGARRVLKELE
jgi:GT2 family glycosyltransferase